MDFEPYLFAIANTGVYNDDWESKSIPTFWVNSFATLIQAGVAPRLDMQIFPTLIWNHCQDKGHWAVGDLPFYVDLQLYYADVGGWAPNVKFMVTEIIPLGKYRNLNPHDHRTEIGGLGSWQTNIAIVLGNVHYLGKGHYLQYRVILNYDLLAPVRVTGFNVYGGGYGANARLFPGQIITFLTSAEVSLSQNWCFSIDLVGEWGSSDHYTGFSGILPTGETAPLGRPSSAQFSMAPAIEYNWSSNLGIIGGAWFSVAGRNSDVFQGGVVALNYLY